MLSRVVATVLLVTFSTQVYAITCGPLQTIESRCAKQVNYGGQIVCAPDGWEEYCQDITNPATDTPDYGVRKCVQTARTCVDDTPVKRINGLDVPSSVVGGCWKWQSTYTCLGGENDNTCDVYENDADCAVATRQCINNDPAAGCLEWEIGYQCIVERGTEGTINVCTDTEICVGGVCWDSGYMPDGDFAEVLTRMEMARQIGVYSPDGLDIFAGEASSCRSMRGGGLKNCCTTDTSARSNNATMGQAISGAGTAAIRVGSKFVFDALYGDTINWVASGWAAALGSNGGQGVIDSISNPGFGMYGFSIGGTGSFLGTAGVPLGSVAGQPMFFNPYALAFALAVQSIMAAMTCSEDEAMLAMRRGAGLCSDRIGSWCEREVLGVCITRKESYCCYNSKLARIINVQGRAQLGFGWGNPESPSCTGFSAYELQQIDFSQIDLSEFTGDVMRAIDLSYLTSDHQAAENGDFVDGALGNACQSTYDAVGGDMSKLPAECRGLVN
ncbi:conjugal transfer protein TraN [Bordetella sp. 15P40C-2]|uniref:conjugal transfer protein TraN n=1 Tax=Bordetella sp. 15P40C-2 TaxID=2572246 RepID=UPI0013285EA5|nr:conjugal transfer protein TraN [Bordetella sp. 15P40C-2]MVW72876.1 conjugal transfer protein TraN [Bordetella sp. 15P40C-2]